MVIETNLKLGFVPYYGDSVIEKFLGEMFDMASILVDGKQKTVYIRDILWRTQ